ncbi:MAG: NfeD family protein, partial [Chthoniobacterales bacterium]|nr:NfeD family protein [Chthoniobacterales bacterium]
EFHGEIFDARTEGEFFQPGSEVVALRVEGSEVVVEKAR